jgi:hypothetical protein
VRDRLQVLGADGSLYGTTESGGTGSCINGCGTAFKLTPPGGPGKPWNETILYHFKGGSDGSIPWNALVEGADGAYYGTTAEGGNPSCFGGYGCGTVFKLTPPARPGGAWKEAVLYRYSVTKAGFFPNPGLTLFRSAFYLSTPGGGDCGTVSRLVPPPKPAGSWQSEVLYDFPVPKPGPAACFGRYPAFPNGLLVEPGVIFGNAAGGVVVNQVPVGIVFALTPPAKPGAQWNIEILHEFLQSPAGTSIPTGAPLVAGRHGVIFGATSQGGSGPCSGGCGTVWQLTPPTTPGRSWTEKILHDFQGPDPASSVAISAGANGVLYGITGGCCSDNGTVFEIVP